MNPSLLTRVLLGLGTLALIGLGVLYYLERAAHQATASTLETQVTALQDENAELNTVLTETVASRDALSRALQEEQAKIQKFEKNLNVLEESVDTLEKLRYTDPELLAKYSKVFFLSENYAPTELARVPEVFSYPPERAHEVHARMLPFLVNMLEDAQEDGIELRVVSAYRSFGTQTALKSSYVVAYGTGANRFSADQGYSEHQLGTTVDLTTADLGASFTTIDSTEAFTWLTDHAHRYGFVLSYPSGNAYYQYEPWHWRFVGRDLADDLHDADKYLYELDQREIDTYLAELFD